MPSCCESSSIKSFLWLLPFERSVRILGQVKIVLYLGEVLKKLPQPAVWRPHRSGPLMGCAVVIAGMSSG